MSLYVYPQKKTIPRVKEARLSNSIATINTDSGQLVASGPELPISIIGSNGITVSAAGDVITIDGLSAGGTWKEDEYVPTVGQVSFSLSQSPQDTNSVFFVINGVIYDDTADYTVSGQTVTWLNTSFSLEITDVVIIKYK